MITGTIILNNLSDDQVAQVLEAEAKHRGKLEINVPAIRSGGPGSTTLHSGIQLGWDTPEGFQAAIGLAGQFVQPIQTAEKTA